MSKRRELPGLQAKGFRAKLLVAMMLVVLGVTFLVLYFAEHNLVTGVERSLQQKFQSELAALGKVRDLRQTALLERCRALVRKPRIHAALEDGALDLLYPSAKDELRDIMAAAAEEAPVDHAYALHAEFYRFLDRAGTLISPDRNEDAGLLHPEESAQLALPHVPEWPQFGYVVRLTESGPEDISELIGMPIVSTETGEVIAMLVLGFQPVFPVDELDDHEIKRGIWYDSRLFLRGLAPAELRDLERNLSDAVTQNHLSSGGFVRRFGGIRYQLYYQQLNPGSLYAPAFEICLYPLRGLDEQKRSLRWQVTGAGFVVLLGGLGLSHFLSGRLSAPVEKMVIDSAENLAQRERAEAELESTNEELQRAARFSADASHQLKTPIAVLRAGLEELQARDDVALPAQQEVTALIRQTYRLSGVIDDLLLLSRLDAGRLKLKFGPVNLSLLIAAALDDLETQLDGAALIIETDVPSGLIIAGEEHYTGLILQNLLENARKYNVTGGCIRVAVRRDGGQVRLTVGNTGHAISPAMREHIFERFHRGKVGENIPGYGLGLNLARELARLHQGELQLKTSADGWTEFEVQFSGMPPASGAETEDS